MRLPQGWVARPWPFCASRARKSQGFWRRLSGNCRLCARQASRHSSILQAASRSIADFAFIFQPRRALPARIAPNSIFTAVRGHRRSAGGAGEFPGDAPGGSRRIHASRLRKRQARPDRGRGPCRSDRGRDRNAAPSGSPPNARRLAAEGGSLAGGASRSGGASGGRDRFRRRGGCRAAGAPEALAGLLAPVRADLIAALAQGRAGEIVREGVTVVIAGPPNAGKSTLLNALAQREAAIVSPVPGTTRDAIEVHLDIGGFAFVLIDTAGLRETARSHRAYRGRRAPAPAPKPPILFFGSARRARRHRAICRPACRFGRCAARAILTAAPAQAFSGDQRGDGRQSRSPDGEARRFRARR